MICTHTEADVVVSFIPDDKSMFHIGVSCLQIKVLNPSTQKVTTLAGTGTAGFKDGTAQEGQVIHSFLIISCW